MADNQEKSIVGRARGMSLSLLNGTPQLGMWQATATAIAQAPNLTELREPESGGSNITFDAHGHSTRIAKADDDGELTLVKTTPKTLNSPIVEAFIPEEADVEPSRHTHKHHGLHRRQTLKEKHSSDKKESWGPTIKHGLKAFWVFFLTPSGFLITIYGLNVVVRLPSPFPIPTNNSRPGAQCSSSSSSTPRPPCATPPATTTTQHARSG